MRGDIIKAEIIVKDTKINVIKVGKINYISLTDLAKYQNSSDPSFTVKNWLRKITTIDYIGLWEQIHNINFNLVEFDQIKTEYGKNTFSMSPKQWIKRTNAIGIISKGGRYSIGTFAHPDIAFEFASWLSPEFKLYLITEFERLKAKESYQAQVEWQANRLLARLNYVVHTDAIKNYIVPELTEAQKKFVYAEEADVLNVALFGMTAKEWRDKNADLAREGNMRDYTDLAHLVILNNLENMNANFIEEKVPQQERLIKLNCIAKRQMEILRSNKTIQELEGLQQKVNHAQHLLSGEK